MKNVYGCVVASNGSLFIVIKPCLKSYSSNRIVVNDYFNHKLWSGLVGEPKTEVSKFIKK